MDMEWKNKAGLHSWGFSGKCSFQSLTLVQKPTVRTMQGDLERKMKEEKE